MAKKNFYVKKKIRKQSTTTNSLSLVRFDDNDYSMPVRYSRHPIVAKGCADRVVLCNKVQRITQHKRSWGKEGIFYGCLHYLPLLERIPGSLDHALSLADLNLPECFETLRRRLEAEREGEGTRKYIRGSGCWKIIPWAS